MKNVSRRFCVLATIVACLAPLSTVTAQVRRPADPSAEIIRDGWTAYAASRFPEAASAGERALATDPLNHDAWGLRLAALARIQATKALDAYDEWSRQSKMEDPFFLAPIALAIAWELVNHKDPVVKAAALELIAEKDPKGFSAVRATAVPDPTPATDAVLAAAGDKPSLGRLQERLDAPGATDKSALLALLGKARGATAVATLRRFLADPYPPNRSEAAIQLGKLGDQGSRTALQQMMQSDVVPQARFSAAVALSALGDQSADALLDQMMASPAPDIRLMAATALAARGERTWQAAAESVLSGEDPLARLRAAELLVVHDADTSGRARQVLTDALSDDNPVMREESGVRAAASIHDLAVLRRLLRAGEPRVRLSTARSILDWPERQ